MKRITLILGVVAVMVVMLVALAAPAMAKGNGTPNNGGHHTSSAMTHHDNKLHNKLHNSSFHRFDRPFRNDSPFRNHVNINSGFSPVI